MEIQNNIKLSQYSTLKIGGDAKYFAVVKSEEELINVIRWANKKSLKIFVLGGGSNILFSDKGFSGLVIKNEIKGIEIIGENENYAIIKSYGGEIWSKLVNFTIDRGWYGLENTFYIPGTVGASPVQNIGAYGTEVKDIFYNLCAIEIKSGNKKFFNLKDCEFSYRDSVFKNKLKGKYFILWVEFKLSKNKKLNLNYPDIQKVLIERNILQPSLKELTEIIREIRDSKLPNPAILANAGSFFKNSIINIDLLEKIKEKYPEVPHYLEKNEKYKIPAGWLIEKCDFKGKRFGQVGVYDKQALILVNHGEANQGDFLFLINKIKIEVKNRFNIDLEEEVNIL